MVQRHTIILWKKAEREKKFEEIASEVYETLNIFQNYSEELRPNFIPGKTKNDSRRIEWNYENLCNILKKGINKEGDNIFEDLGYSLSFFSSMDEKKSCAFQIRAGNKNKKFNNSLIIDLPLSINVFNQEAAEEIRVLFEKLVSIYSPYWGCISNKVLSRKHGRYLEGYCPTSVHWINYWSDIIIQAIGIEKVLKLVEMNPGVSFQNGILLIRNTAPDVDREDDARFYDELQRQLLY